MSKRQKCDFAKFHEILFFKEAGMSTNDMKLSDPSYRDETEQVTYLTKVSSLA